MKIIITVDEKEYDLGSIQTRGGIVEDTNPLTEEIAIYEITKTKT